MGENPSHVEAGVDEGCSGCQRLELGMRDRLRRRNPSFSSWDEWWIGVKGQVSSNAGRNKRSLMIGQEEVG